MAEHSEGGKSWATLRHTRSLFADVRDLLPDSALISIDRNGVIIESTPAVEDLIGSSSATILHRHLDVFVHPDDRELTRPANDERSHTGLASHWTPVRIDTRRGWRRIEFMSFRVEHQGFVVMLRRPPPAVQTDVQAGESVVLDLLSAVHGSQRSVDTMKAVHAALGQLVDLIGWDRARIRFAGDAVVDLTEVSSRPGNSSMVAPLSAVDARIATALRQRHQSDDSRQVWSDERHHLWLNGTGSWFRAPIDIAGDVAWLELAHHQDNVLLSSWQVSMCRNVARVLAATWDHWADSAKPDSLPRPRDPETRLPSLAELFEGLESRLVSDTRVCVFRIQLDGLAALRAKVGDDSAARVMIAVAHGIGFVLDGCEIGRTGEDELTAIAEIHQGETVDEAVEHIREEIVESFSWRFGVQPRIGAAAAEPDVSTSTLFRKAGHAQV